MPTRPALTTLLAIAFGASAVALAPTASAASPYSDAQFSPYRNVSAGNCIVTPLADAPAKVALPTDGTSRNFSHAYSTTVTGNTDSSDITQVSLANHATASMTSRGGEPATVKASYSGSTTVSPSKTPSQCQVYGYAETDVTTNVTLTRPMWVDATMTQKGLGYGEIEVESNGDQSYYIELRNYGTKGSMSQHAYLPAGSYSVYIEGDADPARAGSTSFSALAKVNFTPAGARLAAPSGQATAYASLPAMRKCAAHKVVPVLTGNAGRAATITKVVAYLNEHKVKTITSGFRGKAIPITVADDKPARVKIAVTTAQKQHHKTVRRTRIAYAPYIACS